MIRKRISILIVVTTALLVVGACSSGPALFRKSPPQLKDLVGPIKESVVTVINYDVDGDVSSIGSGFFISKNGILLTNYHVLDGAYNAEIRTLAGERYAVSSVLAKSQLVDLIKVRVEIPGHQVTPVILSDQPPVVADSVFVVGSPMGLEQTVSEGIISAVREIPTGGKILQLTAPISQGSSGGPVLNHEGQAIGVVTFQAAAGQNLNFAVSVDALEMLTAEVAELSVAEWTIRNSRQGPALAAMLCGKGSQLTIQGEYEEALTYFKKAAETNPQDPDAWYGLGSCYVGLDQPTDAIAAYKRPIEHNPDNAVAHFVLAMYLKTIGQYEKEIDSLMEVIRIEPANLRAQFELARVYGQLERTDEQIDAFEAILASDPDHIPTLLNLGATLSGVDRFDEAIRLFNHAGQLSPNNPLIHFNLGVAYDQMDRSDDAIRAYTHAIRANPRMVPAHYNLGMIYLKQEQRKRALDQYAILKALEAEAAARLFEQIYPQSTP